MKNSKLPKEFSNKYLRYHITLEDPETIQNALNISKDDTVLSITSSGCNILNFLIYNPKKIISIDVNTNQNYLLELKITSIKNLTYQEFLEVLGLIPSDRRKILYSKIKQSLSSNAKHFWDSNLDLIEKGITYSGQSNIKKMGKFFRFFIGKKRLEELFKLQKLEEQREFFNKEFSILPIKILYKILYWKIIYFLLKKFNFSFKKLKIKNNKLLGFINPYKRIQHIITDLTINKNYFLSIILLGKYQNENNFPEYLQKKYFEIIKDRVDKIEIKTIRIEEILEILPDNYITKFNLSTTPDFIQDEEINNFFKQIYRVSKNNARFCFFSTESTNKRLLISTKGINFEFDLAERLFKDDRSLLYLDFQVGKIFKI